MIKLRDFLEIANVPVTIMDGPNEILVISDSYFDTDILSQKLLDMKVSIVNAKDRRLLVKLEGDIK